MQRDEQKGAGELMLHTDLFQPSQRYDTQFSFFLFFQKISTSIMIYVSYYFRAQKEQQFTQAAFIKDG